MKNRVGFLLWAVSCVLAPVVQADPALSYRAAGWGSYVVVGPLVQSGLTAPAGISCGAQPGAHVTNSVATINVPTLLSTGAEESNADAFDDATGTASRASDSITGVDVLGLITADAVNAVSTTRRDGTVLATSDAGSTFANLSVLGLPVDANVAPNTRIELPGVGFVRLNEQVRRQGVDSDGLDVNMIHVAVTTTSVIGGINVLAGTHIYVGHAASSLAPVVGSAPVNGLAYTAYVKTPSNLATVGPEGIIANAGCGDTSGQLLTNTTAGVTVPGGLLSTGTGTNTVQATVTPTTAELEATATVEGVNVAGIITATAVKADALASKTGGPITLDGTGSGFVGLGILGLPLINDAVPANTKLGVPGLGTVWLRHEIKTADTLYVIMIDVILDVTNTLGLAPGTRIQVGAATAAVH